MAGAWEGLLRWSDSGLHLDLGDAPAPEPPGMAAALAAMRALEAGALANPDEGRQVGHYWLRAPQLAPAPEPRAALEATLARVSALERDPLDDLLIVGIGGSALGPQLAVDCLREPGDLPRAHFLDNTDPDGFRRVLDPLDPRRTRVLVVSKSGGTVETHNGMLAARARWAAAGVPFPPHAIAITGEGSALDRLAREEGWAMRFPMWDWVGGRTSLTGPVGTVPLALLGHDVPAFLAGAAAMDRDTRRPFAENPAALLAATWFHWGGGAGRRALVVEPYRDRFALLARYLQQLVMESIGKALDRQGRAVHQGLSVYGNKGSTDQHAFVQQLRDGTDDALVHFVETLDPGGRAPGADGADAADHLLGFLHGTRRALREAGRPSVLLTVPDAGARSLGALVALFERAVGIYAELVDVNAYHQPGVEAGKRAARDFLGALTRLAAALSDAPESAQEIAARAGLEARMGWRLLHHLAATGRARCRAGARPEDDRFSREMAPRPA
jgi:glucose-6-phosphate isomerase